MNKTINIILLAVFLAAGMPIVTAGAQSESALEPTAIAILHRMAGYLTGLQAMRVQAEVEYDAVQSDGQRIEFGASREISVRRPDRIRVDAADRRGAQRSLFYDGKQVTLFDQTNAVYATAEQTGEIESILRYLEEELRVPLPLRELVSKRLDEHLTKGLVFADVVGEESIDGVRCDHLALRNEDRGIQLWIEQGEKPLPRRIVITYEGAPGQPQFRARLSGWDVSPQIEDSVFDFKPPQGTEKIMFRSVAGVASAAKEAR